LGEGEKVELNYKVWEKTNFKVFWSFISPNWGNIFQARRGTPSPQLAPKMGTTLSISPKHYQYQGSDYQYHQTGGSTLIANNKKANSFLNSLHWKRFSVLTSSTVLDNTNITHSRKKSDNFIFKDENKENSFLVNGQNFNPSDWIAKAKGNFNNKQKVEPIPNKNNFKVRNTFH